MSNSKANGGTQQFSPGNIEKREREMKKESVLEEWKTWWRESEQVSMCLRKRATEHDRGWSKEVGWATLVQFVFMQPAPHNVLQTQAIFPDKLVASSAIGDLPLAVALTNIPFWEKNRVNQKSGLPPLITNYRLVMVKVDPSQEAQSPLRPQIRAGEEPRPLPALINLFQRRCCWTQSVWAGSNSPDSHLSKDFLIQVGLPPLFLPYVLPSFHPTAKATMEPAWLLFFKFFL